MIMLNAGEDTEKVEPHELVVEWRASIVILEIGLPASYKITSMII